MPLIEKWNTFTKQYLHNRFDDIVFKYRPKKYGAYELRFAVTKNLLIGTVLSFSLFVTAFLGAFTYLNIWGETEKENLFTEYTGFDSKVTDFKLPKGDPKADKLTPAKKKNDHKAKEKKTSPKSKKTLPIITNKDVADTKPLDEKTKDTSKPNSDKDSSASTSKDSKNTADTSATAKGLGSDSTQFGAIGGTEAEPIGGIREFQLYIEKHVVYPPQLKGTKIGGTIFVLFEVDTNGVIDKTRILAGLNAYLDAEAIRVIQTSPKWKPAMQGPIRVRQRFKIGVRINP